MKKYLLAIALFFVAVPALAASVMWDRPTAGRINPLFILDTVYGNKYIGTSTSEASVFPYASTTAVSGTSLCIGSDCRTVWPSAGGSSFGQSWEIFEGSYLAPTSTVKGIIAAASSTIGGGTAGSGLTVSGTASSTLTRVGAGSPSSATTLFSAVAEGSQILASLQTNSNVFTPVIGLHRTRGTIATPTSVQTNDITGQWFSQGYDGTVFDSVARIRFFVGATTTPGVLSGGMDFRTSNVSGTEVTALTITNSQLSGFGSSTPFSKLSVHGLDGETNRTLFAVASSTASATTTLFSIDNTGKIVSIAPSGNTGILGPNQYPAFTYSTSTAWTGTTTIPIGTAYVGETWYGVQCFTDTGTLNVVFNDATNNMNLFNASTTVGTVTLSTNNTFVAAEKRYVSIGTPASSPTKISCTVSKTLTP